MFKRFLPILTLLLIGVVVFAQKPEQVKGLPLNLDTRSPLACKGNASAGTVTRAKGYNNRLNPQFLCMGDTLFVSNQNSNLTEDPVPATAAGIGYIFYDCAPSATGPALSSVKADACIKKTPYNGTSPSQGLWLARGLANGSVNFVNSGTIQSGYNNGKPLQLYFAPVTVYDFAANTATISETTDTACINVNTSASFPVVYLNAIKITNVTTGSNRSGSFLITGGRPEYDASTYTNFRIQHVSKPSVLGTITSTSAATHGSTVTFTVPEDGQYNIVATDNVSCDGSAKVAFPTVQFIVSNESVTTSGSNVCVKVTANNFTNVGSMQFQIKFDPTILQYDKLSNINSGLTGFSDTYINQSAPGTYFVAGWFSNTNITIPSNQTLFEVCFKAIGAVGSSSPVYIFSESAIGEEMEVTDKDGFKYVVDTIRGSVKIGTFPVNIKYSVDSALCNGSSTGVIKVIPTGIGAPFTYTWKSATNASLTGNGSINTISDTGKITGLAAGTYYVTVVNSTLDKRIDTLTVNQPAALFFNPPTAINPCVGANTGSLTLTAFGGGVKPYSFKWNTGATTTSITNLASGTYSCTMTDAKGCQTSVQASIGTNPIDIVAKTVTPALCKEVKNGSIAITSVSGGTPVNGNYTFNWSNNKTSVGTTDLNPNLGAGKYYVTISDNSCSTVDSFIIPAQRTISITATVNNVTCNGASTGTILATATGSSNTPYVFTWTGVTDFTNNVGTSLARTLKVGTYPLRVRDQDGCLADSSFTLTQPAAIVIDSVNQKNETCLIGKDGAITVSAVGGKPGVSGYTYRWSRSSQDNQATISNLVAGLYTVTVTDSTGCQQLRSFTITVPQKPTLSVTTTSATCFEKSDGRAKVIVIPPTGATVTAYNWSNNGVIDSITNLKTGTYRVTVTLSNGCQQDTAAVVNAPAPITLDTLNAKTKNPTCPNDDNGEIILPVKGGTTPYVYTWSGGQPTPNSVFASLKAGVYLFTVTDFNGCQPLEQRVALVAPPDINIAFTDIISTKCYGVCSQNKSDGKATAIASGGAANTGIYSYQWSSGETTNRALELCGGWQRVTVTDQKCFKIDSVEIPQPKALGYLIPVITEPTCYGLKDAKTEIITEGGTPPYSYAWSTGVTTKDLINVGAGAYSVIVTDKNLCVAPPLKIQINQPAPLTLDTVASQTSNVTCYNANDGIIKVARSGGNGGPTQYKWFPDVSQSDSAYQLKSGIYYITATDKKGCTDSISVTITQPDKIFHFLSPPAQPRCYGDLTNVVLDTAFGSTYLYPYTISVDNGPQYPVGYQVPVFAGDHLITVTEQVTGCSDTFSITISQPPPITIRFQNIVDSVPIPRMIVGLGTDARLSPIIGGSLPIDSVVWTPLDYLTKSSEPLRPIVRPLDDRTYKLKVIDVNGCIGEGEIAVELERNRNVYIPNIFSPNGDDKNDYFGVFSGVGVKHINYVRIFDRWGELLFQAQDLAPSSDPSQGWDGTFNKKPVPSGVYVYIAEIEFEDGTKLLYRGDVSIIR